MATWLNILVATCKIKTKLNFLWQMEEQKKKINLKK